MNAGRIHSPAVSLLRRKTRKPITSIEKNRKTCHRYENTLAEAEIIPIVAGPEALATIRVSRNATILIVSTIPIKTQMDL